MESGSATDGICVNKVVNSAINTSKSTDKYNVGMVKQNFPK